MIKTPYGWNMFLVKRSMMRLKTGHYILVQEFKGYRHLIYINETKDGSKVYFIGVLHNELSKEICCQIGTHTKIFVNKKYDEFFGTGETSKITKGQIGTPELYVDQKTNNEKVRVYVELKTFKSLDGIIFKEKDNLLNRINLWERQRIDNERFGINTSLGIMLYGGHGTGKTTLAKALSKHLKAKTFFYMSPDFPCKYKALVEFYQHYYAMNEQGLKILFIDEIDRFLNMCGKGDKQDHTEEKGNIGAFLNQLLSGSKDMSNLIVIGATNRRPEEFPPDLMRKGRFGDVYEMDAIDMELSKKMCDFFEVDYDKVAEWYMEEHGKELPLIPADLQEIILEYRQQSPCISSEECEIIKEANHRSNEESKWQQEMGADPFQSFQKLKRETMI